MSEIESAAHAAFRAGWDAALVATARPAPTARDAEIERLRAALREVICDLYAEDTTWAKRAEMAVNRARAALAAATPAAVPAPSTPGTEAERLRKALETIQVNAENLVRGMVPTIGADARQYFQMIETVCRDALASESDTGTEHAGGGGTT